MDYSKNFLEYLKKAISPFHAVLLVQETLKKRGFTQLQEGFPWNLEAGGAYFVIRNDASLIAFKLPAVLKNLKFNLVASHTDSPTFKVKEKDTIASAAKTFGINCEPYGGMIYASWLDRPLGVAGRAVVKEANCFKTYLVDSQKPLAVMPNLAIHQNRNMNDGYKYNPAVDLVPLYTSNALVTLREILCKSNL